MMRCPTETKLECWLDGAHAAEEQSQITEHISACATCQNTLDRLTTPALVGIGRQSIVRADAESDADRIFIEQLQHNPPKVEASVAESRHDAGASVHEDTKQAPLQIPGYEVLELLGRGGMGLVYRARQIELDRIVAIKVLATSHATDARQRSRFHREASAIAKLNHTNIIQVHEVGDAAGSPYLALEYASGGSLKSRMDSAPMPAVEAARLIRVLACAMQHAHACGIVHRDLKPRNVLFQGNAPKIADFGLAKLLEADSDATGTEEILGTPAYMAPEQATRAVTVGPAADIYGLGVILYEALTGRPPHQGRSSVAVVHAVVHDEPISPRKLSPGVPRDLESICLKCLKKHPLDRYASAAALADDLALFLAGKPTLARPASTLSRCWKWVRRWPTTAAALAVVLLVAIALPIVLSTEWGKTRQALNDAETARHAEREQRRLADANNAQKLVALAHRAWLANDREQAKTLLDACSADERHLEWRQLYWACTAELRTLDNPRGSGFQTLICGPRNLVASIIRPTPSRAGSAFVFHGESGKTIDIDAASGPFLAGAFADDGKQLVFAADANLGLPAVAGRKIAGRKFGPGAALVPALNSIVSWNLATRERTDTYQFAHRPVALSADGRLLALVANGELKICDYAAGAELRSFRRDEGFATKAAFSPDSRLVALSTLTRSCAVWDLTDGAQVLNAAMDEQQVAMALAFAPDGRTLAIATSLAAKKGYRLNLWDLTKTDSPHRAIHLRSEPRAVAFSNDGKTIVVSDTDHSILFFAADSGKRTAELRGHFDSITSLAFSPDDALLFSASQDGMIKTWRMLALPAPASNAP